MGLQVNLVLDHIRAWRAKLLTDTERAQRNIADRAERLTYYGAQTVDKIIAMSEDQLYDYIAKLWAMLIWGNKRYVVDKLIQDNGFDYLKRELAELVWGLSPV